MHNFKKITPQQDSDQIHASKLYENYQESKKE